MKYSLTIDCGNSSTKMAVWADDAIAESVVMASPSQSEVENLIGKYDIADAIVGSVVGDLRAINQVFSRHNIPLTKLNHRSAMPITIDYKTPETLGADRIAAAIGARHIVKSRLLPESCPDILIADIGTAATYDRVSADGHFVGGNIAPGIGMRLQALHQHTAALPKVESRGETPLWGTSTETALRSGAVNGVIAEILFYRSLMENPVVFLTGGWAQRLASELPFEVITEPDLVSLGLKIALDHASGNPKH